MTDTNQVEPKGEMKTLSLKLLTIDTDVQPRRSINEKTVAEYAEAIENGAKFPPVVVFAEGTTNWLASGFHRYYAHEKADKRSIRCDVRQGTKRDAILFAMRANKHGLRLTNDEKRDNVDEMLQDDEWGKWSNGQIARHIGVSAAFVGERKQLLTINVYSENGENERKYVTKHGTEATMNTANIGRKSAPETANDAPPETMPDYDPFDDGDEAAPVEIPSENEPQISEPEREEAPPLTMQRDGKTIEVQRDEISEIHDERREVAAQNAEENNSDLTAEEWLQALPIYRVLSKLQGRGIIARRSLLDWRALQKAQANFAHHAARCETVKRPDGTPLSQILMASARLKSPLNWLICPPCKGNGCDRCGLSGYDLSGAGIDPLRVENGDVTL